MNKSNRIPYLIQVALIVWSVQAQSQIDTLLPNDHVIYAVKSSTIIVNIDLRQKYIYNDNKDTLILPNVDRYADCHCSPLEVVSEIQIDQKGAKEIVFLRNCSVHSVFYESSFSRAALGFIQKYEVWNLDTKERLFEAMNYYRGTYKNELIQRTRFKNYNKGKIFYKYTVTVEASGTIKIQQIRGKDKYLVDKKAGVYTFKEGQYQLIP